MNEMKTTMTFGAVALALAAIAFLMSGPSAEPEAFSDQGQSFYPDFIDPNEAVTLEVIDYNSETGSAVPFKVTFDEGRWRIPSQYDYPADGKERLANTAAGVINITKDDYRTDNTAEHELCGVIDPLDESTTSLAGRGKRVTLKAASGAVLSDLIIGNPVAGADGFRFVRVPGQKRVYSCKVDLDLSTNFIDWIDRDLLQLDGERIREITLKDYSIDERSGRINSRDEITLQDTPDGWTIDRAAKGKVLDTAKVESLARAIDSTMIVGVRKKPAGLSATLSANEAQMQLTNEDLMSLQSRGYFVTRDGQLRSNEGEIQLRTKDGVRYTLRFGEIAQPDAASASDTSSGENRYLFVTAEFLDSEYPEPPKVKDSSYAGKADSLLTDEERKNKQIAEVHFSWEQQVKRGRDIANELSKRFADWYYVISADSYNKMKLSRDALLKDKESQS